MFKKKKKKWPGLEKWTHGCWGQGFSGNGHMRTLQSDGNTLCPVRDLGYLSISLNGKPNIYPLYFM